MKRLKFIFLLALVFITNSASAQESFFFYYQREPQILNISRSHAAINFHPGMAERGLSFIKRERPEIRSVLQPLTDTDFLLIDLEPGVTDAGFLNLLHKLKQYSEIRSVSPVFGDNNRFLILTDEVLVKFKETAQRGLIEKLNQENQMSSKGFILFSDTEIIKTNDMDPFRALAVANLYWESGLVEFAEPNFVRVSEPLATTPNDPYFSSQWNLNYNVSWRADINAPEGWDINRGSTSVKIAILDSGLDLNHYDLRDNMLSGWDATANKAGGWANPWDYHGTAVAGVAAARTNNSIGVSGVCWFCKIIPVRVLYHPCDGCDEVSSLDWLASGIDWAWQNGADVINMSLGWPTSSSAVDAAISRAKTQGRGGKGSILTAAAGNGDPNTSVQYPARNSKVIAVGASNPCGWRKTYGGCASLDGEYWWQSSYGPELDVVAPGVHIYMSDISGTLGCSSQPYRWIAYDYCKNFNGTSAATPHVAGLAGLIISKSLTRTATQVENIIKNTATDVSPTGFDIETGYGLIDVYKALQQ